MLRDLSSLALGNLLRRKLRSYLTVIGVIIGITAVVALIGLGEGLTQFVTAQFGILGADTITVQASGTGFGPPGTGVSSPLQQKDLDRIRQINGVKEAFGRIVEEGTVRFNDRTNIVYIGSIPSGDSRADFYKRVSIDAEYGRLLRDGDTDKIMVGNQFRSDEEFGKTVFVGSKLFVEGKAFEVAGILKKKGSFVVDTTIGMNEETLRELYDFNTDDFDVFLVGAQPGVEIDLVSERIERVMRKQRDVKIGEEDFTVQTAEAAQESLKDTLFAVQLFVYIIASVSILVGGIGITNTMYTSVLERIKEIGTMKAIGAQNKDIFTVFTIESGLIGLSGGIIGCLFGVALSHGLAFLGQLKFDLELIQAHTGIELIIGALLFSFIIGTLAGILPAYRASKLQPVDALNK